MTTDALARRYARAFFDAAIKQDALEQVADDLSVLTDLMRTRREFRYFMLTPRIKKSRKPELLKQMLAQFAHLSLAFVETLIEKRRQKLIPRIQQAFQALVDAQIGLIDVHVKSARPLGPSGVSHIVRQLETQLEKRIRLHTHTQEARVPAAPPAGEAPHIRAQTIPARGRTSVRGRRARLRRGAPISPGKTSSPR